MRMVDDAGDAPGSYGACTDFDGMTHRQMLHMLVGIDQGQVSTVAQSLTDAGNSIGTIASDLQTHMSNLEWESTAGDAFREWGHKVASATHTLSDYASTAGDQMSNAASVLHDVHKDMPPVPENAAVTVATYRQHTHQYGPHGDAAEGVAVPAGAATPSHAEYTQAAGELAAAQTRAADNMTKLGSAYSAATESMGRQSEPVFPALPTQVMPPDPTNVDSHQYDDFGAGAATGSGRRVTPVRTGSAEEPGSGGTSEVTGGSSSGRLHVDGIATDTTGGGTLVAERPPPSGDIHGTGTTTAFPPPTGTGVMTGTDPYAPGGNRSGGTGGGSAPGDEEGTLFGGGPGGRSAARSALGDGIEGGQLVDSPAGAGAGRLRFSTGNVIGDEPGGAYGMPGAGRPGGTGAFAGAAEEGTYANGSAAPLGESEAGGAGMGRGMGMGGMPMSGAGRAGRGRRDGHRPDYLVEEDETWTADGIGIVPSVFE